MVKDKIPVITLSRATKCSGASHGAERTNSPGLELHEYAEFEFESDAEAAWAHTLAHDVLANFKAAMEKLRE